MNLTSETLTPPSCARFISSVASVRIAKPFGAEVRRFA